MSTSQLVMNFSASLKEATELQTSGQRDKPKFVFFVWSWKREQNHRLVVNVTREYEHCCTPQLVMDFAFGHELLPESGGGNRTTGYDSGQRGTRNYEHCCYPAAGHELSPES